MTDETGHDPFAPLGNGPIPPPRPGAADAKDGAKGDGDWRPILPAEAPLPAVIRHPKYGPPSMGWSYLGSKAELLFSVYRFDTANGERGKAYRPFTRCARGDRRRWCFIAPPVPRPLYGLDRLAARPDARVLLVEGEKAADAAQALFPEWVCMTWPGGADAVGSADLSVLAGRAVDFWPDNDAAGRKSVADVVKALRGIAASVAVVDAPADWRKPDGEDGWDVADPPPAGVTVETLRRMLDEAKPADADGHADAEAGADADAEADEAGDGAAAMPPGFALRGGGVFRRSDDPDRPDIHVCGPLHVLAATHDGDGHAWGVLLRWHDQDGRMQDWPMPRRMLAGDATEMRAQLLDRGLFVGPSRSAREALSAYLMLANPKARVRVVNRVGWHRTPEGRVFVLPRATVGPAGADAVRLQTETMDLLPRLRAAGELEDWKREVAGPCRGNARLVFGVSAGLAPPLLEPLGCDGGGVHYGGDSSIGKTIAQLVAGSVWGGGTDKGWLRSWRTTANALEATATEHNDLLLCLDEINQVAGEELDAAAYMLANGQGKARGMPHGGVRRVAEWRTLFLSSGEKGLADRLATARGGPRRAQAGQEVRVVEVPGDAGAGMGLFEDLHGAPDAETFANTVKDAALRLYGTAGPAFLGRLTADLDALTAAAREAMRAFEAEHVPGGAGGQVRRVAHRFALVAAAGEMAAALGIVPWEPGEAEAAAARCFGDWLAGRAAGAGSAEAAAAVAQVQRFLEAHGDARFTPIVRGCDGEVVEDQGRPTINRAGFRVRDGDGAWTYWILPEVWKADVCLGLDPQAAAKALYKAGHLERGDGNNLPASKYVPGLGKTIRLYVVRASIFSG
jgi:uncharacterized protein (DUF927 family)